MGLKLKEVGVLMDEKYFIPSYQRGYRWGRHQMHQLLTDVADAMAKDLKTYLLQPIVVKPNDGKFELIDGQQRVTSLWIILHYFALKNPDVWGEDFPNDTLTYQTRPESTAFLAKLGTDEECSLETIDEEHFKECYDETVRYFDEEVRASLVPGEKMFKRLNAFYEYLNDHVKVLWYQVENALAAERGENIFMSLNRGRIPLVNSELIKTLLLLKVSEGMPSKESERQTEISSQWDEMERELSEDEFWAFVAGNESPGDKPRMEYFFRLLPRPCEDVEWGAREGDDFAVFNHFEDWLKSITARNLCEDYVLETVWRGFIRAKYLRLREWFEDVRMFHLVGFLTAVNKNAENRRALFEELLASTCLKWELEFLIRKRIKAVIGEMDLDELRYDKLEKVNQVLLLFNVVSCMNEAQIAKTPLAEWYSFARHFSNHWSVEHINPQRESEQIAAGKETLQEWVEWLRGHQACLEVLQEDSLPRADGVKTIAELKFEIKSVLANGGSSLTKEKFLELRKGIVLRFAADFDSDEENGLGNLALLSKDQNSSLGASVFLKKRESVTKFVSNGQFVPFCTRRVFLKYYTSSSPSENPNKYSFAFWTKEDAEEYKKEIKSVISEYLDDDTEEE